MGRLPRLACTAHERGQEGFLGRGPFALKTT